MGALDANKVIQGQRWRIFTCMWLHAGVFHIFTNMLSLLSVGIRLEQEFGFGNRIFLHLNLLYNRRLIKFSFELFWCSKNRIALYSVRNGW